MRSAEGKELQKWEHLMHGLCEPSDYAHISQCGCINQMRGGKILDGSYVKTSPDKFKIFMNPSGFSSYVYRGENERYEHFTPSVYRASRSEIAEGERFIRALKKSPIYDFFSSQPVKFGDDELSFDIDPTAIAQHYGFPTSYLDLTRDEDVARFFAYTYKDEITGERKPIRDFIKYRPSLYRAHIVDIYKMYGCEPIGFQPFLRPIRQWALAVNLGDDYTGVKSLFEEIELEHSAETALAIWKKFHGGKTLFPDEPMAAFIEKYSPEFSTTLGWDEDYVESLRGWLAEHVGWRGTSEAAGSGIAAPE